MSNEPHKLISPDTSLDISFIVIPIVDNGSIENKKQEDHLVGFLIDNIERLRSNNQKIVFEPDFEPKTLSRFIERFDSEYFLLIRRLGPIAKTLGSLPWRHTSHKSGRQMD